MKILNSSVKIRRHQQLVMPIEGGSFKQLTSTRSKEKEKCIQITRADKTQILRRKTTNTLTLIWNGYQSMQFLHKHKGLVDGHGLGGSCANTIAKAYWNSLLMLGRILSLEREMLTSEAINDSSCHLRVVASCNGNSEKEKCIRLTKNVHIEEEERQHNT